MQSFMLSSKVHNSLNIWTLEPVLWCQSKAHIQLPISN